MLISNLTLDCLLIKDFMAKKIKIIKKPIDEFKLIFQKFILPLLGINDSGATQRKIKNDGEELIVLKGQNLIFYESKTSDKCFVVKVSKKFPISSLHLLRTVYSNMLGARYYNFDGTIKNNYDSMQHLIKNYEYYVQKSLLNWFSGSKANLLLLIETLEQWKQRTYEGKKVPFAFLIDLDSTSGEFPFIDFLEDEYSATFSDGITSIIELDSNLCFLDFKSITSLDCKIEPSLSRAPFRFSQVIETFTQDKIAIFLLINGDIVLVKNCEIMFVKRDGKWLNFNKDVFKSIISAELNNFSDNFMKLLDEIYLSALDVSFAHSGGIVACILENKIDELFKMAEDKVETIDKVEVNGKDNKEDEKTTKVAILDDLDNIYSNNCFVVPKRFSSKELKKRYLKRDFLERVIEDKKFNEIDRNLRCEMISMDGATILDCNGKIISVGAIIQNDSGSYGGGRGAAARKLSKFGFAVKISTDGYVEFYVDGRIKYRIK